MNNLLDQIIAPDNIMWAWQKARKAFSIGDIWYCNYQLSKFEANLDEEIKSIAKDIKEGKYRQEKLQICPFPKGYDQDDLKPRARQAFYISVRDQVTWLAVCNIIAPILDKQMPTWSYGNRIYRPAWYEQKQDKRELIIGNYRNSNGYIYRKWKQSWPLFRKHITATLKIMANPNLNKLGHNDNQIEDEETKQIIEENEKLDRNQQLNFLTKGYFSHDKVDDIFWASLDFKKFYPLLKRNKIRDIIIEDLSKNRKSEVLFCKLIDSLFDFNIDFTDWNKADLEDLDLFTELPFEGLPTGLLVAGFLANIALLKIDKEVCKLLDKNKTIAHFRFVDDHVILSTSFDSLIDWIKKYVDVLNSFEVGAEIGEDKTEPKGLSTLLSLTKVDDKVYNEAYNLAEKSCRLDPQYPSPLMTQTLAKVSAISKMELDLMSNDELEQLTSDLKHLLITDFPDQEVKKETRISFAATMLSKTVSRKQYDYNGIYIEKLNLLRIQKEVGDQEKYTDLRRIIENILAEDLTLDFIKKQIVFLINKYPNTISQEDNYIKSSYTSIIEIRDILLVIEKEKTTLDRQVYNLIQKAIKENHQKVRLWIRLIQFCYTQNYNRYKELWMLIDKLFENEIAHRLSTAFLYYMYLALVVELMWKSVRIILNNKCSNDEFLKCRSFIDFFSSSDIISEIFKKEDFDKRDNYKSIFIQFRVVLGTAKYILEQTLPKYFEDYKIIDWNNKPDEWLVSQRKLNDVNSWLFSIFNNTHNFEYEEPHKFWSDIISFAQIDELASMKPLILPFSEEKVLQSIISKYPDYRNEIPSIIGEEGWLFDYYQTVDDVHKQSLLERIKEIKPNLYRNINSKKEKTLYDWILLLQKEQVSNEDIRFSEVTTLNLILNIIKALKKKNSSINNLIESEVIYIHPANFYLPDDFFETFPNTWIDLEKRMINLNIIIRPENERIKDERYEVSSSNMVFHNKELSNLYGLSILMIQLFCRKTTFPWIWNLADRNLIWTKAVTKKLSFNAISSISQYIIQASLSARNRETMLLKRLGIKVTDDNFDPVTIFSLEGLEQEINDALEILKKNQISVENNSPRQLIPISLVQLSKNNNPFKSIANE